MEDEVNNIIEAIAKKFLHIDTLDKRNWDRLDFHDLAIWQIKEALLAAYEAGFSSRSS